jgi:hypothetical protein
MRVTPILASAIMALATSANAAPADPAATPHAAPASMPAPSADTPAADAAAPAATEAPAASANPVADKVAADWPKYDNGNKGSLNKAEFGKWMTDLRSSAGQKAPDAAWLKTAFAQTDTDKNAKVSAAELTAFLSAGA